MQPDAHWLSLSNAPDGCKLHANLIRGSSEQRHLAAPHVVRRRSHATHRTHAQRGTHPTLTRLRHCLLRMMNEDDENDDNDDGGAVSDYLSAARTTDNSGVRRVRVEAALFQ